MYKIDNDLQNLTPYHHLYCYLASFQVSLLLSLCLLESILILFTLHCANKVYRGIESERQIIRLL